MIPLITLMVVMLALAVEVGWIIRCRSCRRGRQRTRISRRGSGAGKGAGDTLSSLPDCTPIDEPFGLVPVCPCSLPAVPALVVGGKFANGVACRGEACWGEACWT